MDYDIDIYNKISMIELVYEQQYEEHENYMGKLIDILTLYDFTETKANNIAKALNIIIPNQLRLLEEYRGYEQVLVKLNEILQDNFVKNSGAERHLTIDRIDSTQKDELKELLKPYTSEILDGIDEENIIILGSSESDFRNRFSFLIESVNKENNTTIYPAGGQRDLWLDREDITVTLLAEKLYEKDNKISIEEIKNDVNQSKQELFKEFFETEKEIKNRSDDHKSQDILNKKLIEARNNSIEYFKNLGVEWPTETDMIRKIINDAKSSTSLTQLRIPKNITIEDVLDPKKYDDGRRPDTISNYTSFIEKYKDRLSDVKSIAIVSSQPYVEYQLEQAKTIFWRNKEDIEIKVIAKGKDEIKNYSDVFNSIARTIFAGKDRVIEKAKKLDISNQNVNFITNNMNG